MWFFPADRRYIARVCQRIEFLSLSIPTTANSLAMTIIQLLAVRNRLAQPLLFTRAIEAANRWVNIVELLIFPQREVERPATRHSRSPSLLTVWYHEMLQR